MFVNSSGITTELNSSGAAGLGTGGDVQISSINVDNDGLHCYSRSSKSWNVF